MEIRFGVGGNEAKLWSKDLCDVITQLLRYIANI